MPSYYDDEEDPNVLGTDTEEGYMPASFPTVDQVSMDRALSAQLPSSQPQFIAARPMGEATREFATGRPGLFIQGGPTVPAGMIEVNGQLERSQAAPQPVPWWITAADQFKEQRRQEDFLRSLVAQSGPQGEQAVSRFKQLQARMNVDAAVKKGTPLRDALMQNPDALSGAPHALARLATSRAPAGPVTGVQEFTGKSGRQYYVDPATGGVKPLQIPKAPAEDASVAQKLAFWSHVINNIEKERETAKYARDPKAIEAVKKKEEAAWAQANKLLKLAQPQEQAAPAPKATGDDIAERQLARAKELRKEHPEWSVEKVKSEARKVK